MRLNRILATMLAFVLLSCAHSRVEREPSGLNTKWVSLPPQWEIAACFEATCGPAEHNWSAPRVFERPGNDLTPLNQWQNEFVPVLRRLAEADFEHNRKNFAKIEEVLAQPPPKTIPLTWANLIKLRRINSAVETQAIDYSKWPVVSLHEANLKKIVDGLKSDNEREMFKRYLKVLFETLYLHHPQVVTDRVNNAIALRLNRVYPYFSQLEALKTDGKTLLAAQAELKDKLGEDASRNLIDEFSVHLFTRGAAGDDFTMLEGELYVSAANQVEFLKEIILGEEFWKLLSEIPFNSQAELEQVRSGNAMSEWKKWLNQHDVNLSVKKVSEYCYPRLSQAIANSASGLRLAKAEQMIADVRQAATTVARRYYTDPTHDYMGEIIAKIKFTTPETPADLYTRMRRGVAELESRNKRKRIAREEGALLAQAVMVADSVRDLGSDLDGLSTLKRTCDQLPLSDLDDRAISLQAKVRLSWYAANYPEVGVSSVAHEMGHVASRFLQLGIRVMTIANALSIVKVAADSTPAPPLPNPYSNYVTSKMCTTGRNPFVPIEDRGQSEDKQWSEEDWADQFSVRVLQELERMGSKWASSRNFACAFAEIKNGRYDEQTAAPDPKDPHSANILRLLLMGTQRGNLPVECQPLVQRLWRGSEVPQCI